MSSVHVFVCDVHPGWSMEYCKHMYSLLYYTRTYSTWSSSFVFRRPSAVAAGRLHLMGNSVISEEATTNLP